MTDLANTMPAAAMPHQGNPATSPSVGKLADALSKAQGEFSHAKKDVKNDFFKSTYADLASVIDAARPALSKNGLSVTQTTEIGHNDRVVLVTTLMHSSGEWIRSRYPVSPVKNDPQGVGSAMTYARRYSFSAITGIASEDDDGNAASGNGVPPAAAKGAKPDPQLAAYNAAKAEYAIKVEYLPDGHPNYEAFVADIESELQSARSMNDCAMLKKANAKTINAMKDDRPELFEFVKETFTKYSNAYL